MPDIVERAIRPYNPPDATVISKDEYTMFTPIASPTNAGMIAYSDGDFLLKDGVLYLSSTYRAKIERAIALGDWLPEQVKALELSISMAIGQKFAVTPSTSQVTVADKYLFITEVGVLTGTLPEEDDYIVAYNTEDDSWYLTYDNANYELESLASIGLSASDDYTDSFTVALALVDVAEGDVGYHDNALYYSQLAQAAQAAARISAASAQSSSLTAQEQRALAQIAAQNATAEALKAEGYALGKQNGVDVQQGSTYYQNNAYYFLKEAGRAVNDAKDYADSASGYATDAQNSAFFAELNKQSASAASAEAKEARDQARAARDDVLGALGAGVEVDPIPNTVPKRDANGKLYAASPSAADAGNVVATKTFVNSSVATNTANFLGTYTYTGTDDHNAIALWIPSQLPAGTTVTNQDYVFVQLTVSGNTKYERYKYNSNDAAWGYEYELNNSSFTAAQWAAINSGITSQDIAAIQTALDNFADMLDQQQEDLGGLVDDVDTLQNTKQNVIDANNKLSSDLVDDTNSQTHKFVTPTEKATWNGKQAALTAGRNISLAGNIADFSIPFVVLSASAGDTIDVANGTVALSANHSAVFANNDFVRVQCNDLFGNNGDTYVFQRTYNEPAANNEKIEYFEYVDVGFYGNPLGTKAHTYIFYYTTGTTPITLGFIDREADGGGASYTAGDGIDITNNVISVDLEYYTAEEIDALWYGTYTITASVTNGAGTSGSITGKPTATATITITPSTGYTLPATVTVTNATLVTYDSTTGDVTVTAATGNVTVTAVCESALVMPTKGDLISMTLGNATPAAGIADTYRVLKVNGTQAEVVAMFDQSTSQKFNSSNEAGNRYSGSSLDTYFTDWYNNLNTDAKAAIVSKTFTQDSWHGNTNGNPDYNGTYWTSSNSANAYQCSLGSTTYGAEITRNVYALSVQDIIDYLEVTPSMTTANTTLTATNVWTMFWNTQSRPSTAYPWLRSASADRSVFGCYVGTDNGNVGSNNGVGGKQAARPAFTIDLSKISFTII